MQRLLGVTSPTTATSSTTSSTSSTRRSRSTPSCSRGSSPRSPSCSRSRSRAPASPCTRRCRPSTSSSPRSRSSTAGSATGRSGSSTRSPTTRARAASSSARPRPTPGRSTCGSPARVPPQRRGRRHGGRRGRPRLAGHLARLARQHRRRRGSTLEAGHVVLPGSVMRHSRSPPATLHRRRLPGSAASPPVRLRSTCSDMPTDHGHRRHRRPRQHRHRPMFKLMRRSDVIEPRYMIGVDPAVRRSSPAPPSSASRPAPRAWTGCSRRTSCPTSSSRHVAKAHAANAPALRRGRHPRHRPHSGRGRPVRRARRSTSTCTSTR